MTEATETSARKGGRLAVRSVIILAVVLIAGIFLWLLLTPGTRADAELFTGYVVSDDIYMSSPVAGTLTGVSVRRGQRVNAGSPLFRVDPTVREAQTEPARATIDAIQAQVAQQKAGLAHTRTDLAAAQADADRYGLKDTASPPLSAKSRARSRSSISTRPARHTRGAAQARWSANPA